MRGLLRWTWAKKPVPSLTVRTRNVSHDDETGEKSVQLLDESVDETSDDLSDERSTSKNEGNGVVYIVTT